MMPNSHVRLISSLTAGVLVAAGLGLALSQVVHADQILGRQRAGAVPTFSGRADAEAVARRLYHAILDRDGEPQGINQATAEIQKGNLTQQVNAMVASQEFRQKIANMTSPQILNQFYRGMLNRAPDRAGLDAFLPRIEQRQFAGVLLEMAGSTEFRESLGTSTPPTATGGGPLSVKPTSRTEAALLCQAKVITAYSRDVPGRRVFISFDQMPTTSMDMNTVSGRGVDRLDNNRTVTYRCDGSTVSYSHDDGRPPVGADPRQNFGAATIDACIAGAAGEFRGVPVQAITMTTTDVDRQFYIQAYSQVEGQPVYVVCELDYTRIVSIRRR